MFFCCFNALFSFFWILLVSLMFCFVQCSLLMNEFVWFVVHSIFVYSVFHRFCVFYDCFLFFLVFSSISFNLDVFFNLSRFIVLSFIFEYYVFPFIHFLDILFFFHLLLYVLFEVFFNFKRLESRKYTYYILYHKHTHTHTHTST